MVIVTPQRMVLAVPLAEPASFVKRMERGFKFFIGFIVNISVGAVRFRSRDIQLDMRVPESFELASFRDEDCALAVIPLEHFRRSDIQLPAERFNRDPERPVIERAD